MRESAVIDRGFHKATNRKLTSADMKLFTCILLAALLPCVSGGCAAGGKEPVPARNVILITLDTQRVDYIGAFGGSRADTPSIDRLASMGYSFPDCTSAAFGTTPSHASIMTSTYSAQHGVYHNDMALGGDSVTMAEILDASGFETAAFVSAAPLQRVVALDQGFDYYSDEFPPNPMGLHERNAQQVTDDAMAWLESAPRESLFMWVHYFDPHWNYNPPREFLSGRVNIAEETRKAGKIILPEEAERYRTDGYKVVNRPDGVFAIPDKEYLRIQTLLYAAEVSFMDLHIGRLLTSLEELGYMKNSIVIIVADHGETLDDENHEAPFTHMTLYQEVAHVPLVIYAGGVFEGGVKSSRPVSTLDILPTVLKYLGRDMPEGVAAGGIPLQDPVSGGDEERPVFFESARKMAAGVKLGKMKFIRVYSPEKFFRYSGASDEALMFDLSADPLEQENLAGGGMPEEKELSNLLDEWRKTLAPAGPSSGAGEIRDEEYRRKLKQLGYM